MAPAADIRQYPDAQAYEEATLEQGVGSKIPVVTTEAAHDGSETRPAGSLRWGEAIVGVFLALLPLYFAAFAIAAYVRNGTLANSFRNVAILQMSKFVCQRQPAPDLTQHADFAIESDDLPHNLHFDIRKVHQGARQLEARARCNSWAYPTPAGQPFVGVFGGYTRQTRNCKPSRASARHDLGDESTRWTALLEGCVERDEYH
jgi:hypothetical protein